MLTFMELICASPFYKAEIIGGWKGKDKSFSNVGDTPTKAETILLLLPSNNETVSQLQDYLSLQRVQGILLYGEMEHPIASTDLEWIEDHHKPVLYIEEETNPVILKKNITDLAHLKSIGLYQYVFEQSTHYSLQYIDEQGLASFFQRLSHVLDQEIYLLDEHFFLDSIHGENRDVFKHLESLYQAQLSANYPTESLSIVQDGLEHYFLFPLVSEDQYYGFVLFQEKPNAMIDICIELITHTRPALLAYLKKEAAVLQAHQSYKDDFLYNLLYNNIESEQLLIQQGKRWGWDFTIPSELMVLRVNQKDETKKLNIDTDSMMKKIQFIISTRFLQGIILLLQGDIIIIVFDSEPLQPEQRKELALSIAREIHKKIELDFPHLNCGIGIGRHYSSNMELFRSFYEAKVAIELGKYEMRQASVRHFEDIGIARLLSNIHRNTLHEYYSEVLKEILHDHENKTLYLDTLEAFFQHNADINQTAEQLYVHPNTLRKRIKKLESILNADFNQLEDLFEIYVAIKVMKMLK
ncbi:helix-turn-helix domain-containing protein [Niallia sp. XMNu-256]|uniref:PucR family transcriptional regulator n=1 Tax=Niallia sp. XMNu-256 TaxID=3082444 RepID=UPI0030CB8761